MAIKTYPYDNKRLVVIVVMGLHLDVSTEDTWALGKSPRLYSTVNTSISWCLVRIPRPLISLVSNNPLFSVFCFVAFLFVNRILFMISHVVIANIRFCTLLAFVQRAIFHLWMPVEF